MRNLIVAFFMAWGNFLTVPCPYKRWDSKLKNLMLAMIPGVGLVAGLIWAAIWMIVVRLGLPILLGSVILTFALFFVCGFMHLDGFMDVNDAVMSRRPLEDRRRILKDSTVGAFAVITVIFLILCNFSSIITIQARFEIYTDAIIIGAIPIVSRTVSGICVLSFSPMETSQYAEDHKESTLKYAVGAILFGIVAMIIMTVIGCLVMNGEYGEFIWKAPLYVTTGMIKVIFWTTLGTFLACLYARNDLKGMNGDIAGYSICVGEAVGLVALALWL